MIYEFVGGPKDGELHDLPVDPSRRPVYPVHSADSKVEPIIGFYQGVGVGPSGHPLMAWRNPDDPEAPEE